MYFFVKRRSFFSFNTGADSFKTDELRAATHVLLMDALALKMGNCMKNTVQLMKKKAGIRSYIIRFKLMKNSYDQIEEDVNHA